MAAQHQTPTAQLKNRKRAKFSTSWMPFTITHPSNHRAFLDAATRIWIALPCNAVSASSMVMSQLVMASNENSSVWPSESFC